MHCIQFDVEHGERYDPLVQIMINDLGRRHEVIAQRTQLDAEHAKHADAVCLLQAGSLMPILPDSVARLLRVEWSIRSCALDCSLKNCRDDLGDPR